MSRISENIRKITKAWGGKTTGNGISDALSDLYNNLPFGVKTEMVEIVPEQSVTGSYNEGAQAYVFNNPNFKQLNIGTTYNVSINGVVYKAECTGDEVILYLTVFDGGTPMFNYAKDDVEAMIEAVYWSRSLGETITLAIYEEQEVVKPMNATFADIIISNEDGVFSCNTTYAELRKMCEIDPLSIVNVKYVEKTNINTEIKLTVKQLKNLNIYKTQFAFEFGDYNSSTVVLYNSDGTIGTAGPV